MKISTETPDLLDATLQEVHNREELPSVTALVCHAGEIIWIKSFGFADLENRRPAGEQTIYHLGSLTKVFTALMLMQLRDAGRLDLDERLDTILPEVGASRLPPITLRQLASHTAGLPLMPPLDTLASAMQEFPPRMETLESMSFPSMDEILAALPVVSPESQPGERASYSNLGVALLARALEAAAGQEYTTYVESQILEPLGMRESGFTEKMLEDPGAAVCYLPFFQPPVAAPAATKRIGGFTPAGGLWSSARDMGRFLALLTSPESNSNSPVLSRASLLEMLERQASTGSSRYTGAQGRAGVGIGWFLSEIGGKLLAEHGGADPSTSAYLAWIPAQQFGLFIASNTGGNPLALAEAGMSLLEKACKGMLEAAGSDGNNQPLLW